MVTQPYYDRLGKIESGGRADARNPKSSAKGKYQFIDATAKQYGITAPFGTPEYTAQEEQAVRRFTEDNAKTLRGSLGREPTPGELYLAHQQGAGGALKLLANADAPVIDLVGRDAALNNRGTADMRAGDFAKQWTSKFDDIGGADAGNGLLIQASAQGSMPELSPQADDFSGWEDVTPTTPTPQAVQADDFSGWEDVTPQEQAPQDPKTDKYRLPKVGLNEGVRGAAGFVDSFANFPSNAVNVGKFGLSKLGVIPEGEGFMPGDEGYLPPEDFLGRMTSPDYFENPNRLTSVLEQTGLLDPEYYADPNNRAEGVTAFTAQTLATGGINPRTVVQKGIDDGLIAALRNLAGQTAQSTLTQGLPGGVAGQAVQQTLGADNPYTAVLKPAAEFVVSAGAGMAPEVLAPSPGRIAAESLKGLTPQQLQQAQELVDLSRQIGAPVTGAEAIAKIVGGKNRLQDVQMVAEEAAGGRPIMDPFMNARAAGNQNALNSTLDQMGPASAAPEMVPARMADTAEKVVRDATNARTQAVQPFYTAAADETIDPQALEPILGSIAETLSRSGEGSDIGKILSQMTGRLGSDVVDPDGSVVFTPQTQVGPLDVAYRELGEMLNKGPLEPGSVGSSTRGAVQPIVSQLGDVLATNPNIKQGRELYSNITEETVRPLQEGQIGALASKNPDPGQAVSPENLMNAQSNVLMPLTPKATSPQVIRQTVKLLKSQDPKVASEWTRQNIKGVFDELGRRKDKSTQGTAFMRQIAGNPGQRDNLYALIEESSGTQAREGFENFIKVMDAQDTRLATGSNTAGKTETKQDLGSGVSGDVGLTPVRLVAKFYNDLRYSRNSEQMAKILTDPRSVDLLKELARTAPKSQKARLIVNSIIASNYEPPPEENQDNPPQE